MTLIRFNLILGVTTLALGCSGEQPDTQAASSSPVAYPAGVWASTVLAPDAPEDTLAEASPADEARGDATTASRTVTTSGRRVLALINGKVFTSNPERLLVEAVAIKGKRILSVGTTDEVLAAAGPEAEVLDLGGRLVTPGLNDAHVHLLPFNVLGPEVLPLIPGGGPTVEDVQAALAAAAAANPPGTWLYGFVGYSFIDDPRANKLVLDAVAPSHPVVLTGWAGHNAYLNSAALAELGLSAATPDPFGGRYGRLEGSSELNGLVQEYAEWRLLRAMRDRLSVEQLRAQFEASTRVAAQFGVTSVQDMAFMAYPRLWEVLRGTELPVRLRAICMPLTVEESQSGCRPPSGSDPHSNRLRFGGVKWLHDGTPVERLASLRAPYSDRPAEQGFFVFPEAAYDMMIEDTLGADAPNGQRLFHTVGDDSMDALLDTMAAVEPRDRRWRQRRVRVEHGDLIQPGHIAPLVERGMVVVQNGTHLAVPDLFHARFGAERTAAAQPLDSLLESGVVVALGSDAFGPGNPFLDIFLAMIHPTHPSEALSITDALLAYTVGGAYAEHMERRKGTLAPGKLADLAVLSQDLLTIPPGAIPGTYSVLTIVDGDVVWETGDLARNAH